MVDSPPRRPRPTEDREIDYIICKECHSPCYIFETDGGRVKEAQCLVCGNDEAPKFDLEEEPDEDDE
jgi:translation initiation factor 2 beta subunit (eIF-2beta)/eIF-5